MRRLIRKLCERKYKHLVPIRSMVIRWNTCYFEMIRGIELKPVSHFLRLESFKAQLINHRRQSHNGLNP